MQTWPNWGNTVVSACQLQLKKKKFLFFLHFYSNWPSKFLYSAEYSGWYLQDSIASFSPLSDPAEKKKNKHKPIMFCDLFKRLLQKQYKDTNFLLSSQSDSKEGKTYQFAQEFMQFKTSYLHCCTFRFADEYSLNNHVTGIRAAVDFTIQMVLKYLSLTEYTLPTRLRFRLTKFSPLLYLTKVDSNGMTKPGLKTKKLEERI